MTNVSQMKISTMEMTLREILRDVRAGRITYIEMAIQREDEDEFVEWDSKKMGDKSYATQHLLAQLGLMYLSSQDIVGYMMEYANED